jgi:hypothetical protein
MFYIQISNGLLRSGHRKRMGESVWEFMWFIDHITKIDEEGFGWVLGGKPINLKDLTEDMGVHYTTVSRNVQKLVKHGYIMVSYMPYGIIVKVMKAKKRFKKQNGNAVENPVDRKKSFSTNAKRFSGYAKPNNVVRQVPQKTVYKYTSAKNLKNLKKLEELKRPLMQKTI